MLKCLGHVSPCESLSLPVLVLQFNSIGKYGNDDDDGSMGETLLTPLRLQRVD